MTLFGCLLIPLCSLLRIFWYALTIIIYYSQIILSSNLALLRSSQKIFYSFFVILWYTLSLVIH